MNIEIIENVDNLSIFVKLSLYLKQIYHVFLLVAFASALTKRTMISRRPIMQEVRHHLIKTLTAHRVANSETLSQFYTCAC